MMSILIMEKCMAAAIWKLVTSANLWSMANHFRKSTAGLTVQEVCSVIQRVLATQFLCLTNLKEVIIGLPSWAF